MSRGLLRRASVGAGVLGAVVALATIRRWHSVRAVAPELRSSTVMVPFSMGTRRELGLVRSLLAVESDPVVPGVERTARIVDGVRVFVHTPSAPASGPRGGLLWIHGGGFVAGAAAGDHELCGRLAAELDVVVVSVDYRLAPEHPFPAALDDCARALALLHDRPDELGVDPARIAVVGASAGGGLTAALVQWAHDRGDLPVRFQALVYPMLDDRTARRRVPAPVGRVLWTQRSNRFAWRCYLAQRPGLPEVPEYAVPARRTDLHGLPPAWIGVGELDLFHDEDVAYAGRLAEAGVPVSLHVEPRMPHGADVLFPAAPSMRRFRGALVRALGEALRPD